jgi:hypothetical protein
MIKYFDTEKFNILRKIKEEFNDNIEITNICDIIIKKMNHGLECQNEWKNFLEKFPEVFL